MTLQRIALPGLTLAGGVVVALGVVLAVTGGEDPGGQGPNGAGAEGGNALTVRLPPAEERDRAPVAGGGGGGGLRDGLASLNASSLRARAGSVAAFVPVRGEPQSPREGSGGDRRPSGRLRGEARDRGRRGLPAAGPVTRPAAPVRPVETPSGQAADAGGGGGQDSGGTTRPPKRTPPGHARKPAKPEHAAHRPGKPANPGNGKGQGRGNGKDGNGKGQGPGDGKSNRKVETEAPTTPAPAATPAPTVPPAATPEGDCRKPGNGGGQGGPGSCKPEGHPGLHPKD